MKINNSKYGQGLFGLVDSGEIKNINLGENCSLNMQGNGCGGIVGASNGPEWEEYKNQFHTIINCGNYGVGGIAGILSKGSTNSFENCYNIGVIQEMGSSNELIGYNESETQIINSHTSLDTFTAEDLGEAYQEDKENINAGYPILSWQ